MKDPSFAYKQRKKLYSIALHGDVGHDRHGFDTGDPGHLVLDNVDSAHI